MKGDTIDLGNLLWKFNKIKENTRKKIPKAHRTLVGKRHGGKKETFSFLMKHIHRFI